VLAQTSAMPPAAMRARVTRAVLLAIFLSP
jgi:hypothetical protein